LDFAFDALVDGGMADQSQCSLVAFQRLILAVDAQ
jgi:hypothetical protein